MVKEIGNETETTMELVTDVDMLTESRVSIQRHTLLTFHFHIEETIYNNCMPVIVN